MLAILILSIRRNTRTRQKNDRAISWTNADSSARKVSLQYLGQDTGTAKKDKDVKGNERAKACYALQILTYAKNIELISDRIQWLANEISMNKLAAVSTDKRPAIDSDTQKNADALKTLSETEGTLFSVVNFASMTIQSIVDVTDANDLAGRKIDFERLQLISKYPDAANLLGGSGISFKGTSAGSVATVKANVSGFIPDLPVSVVNTIALSAPTSKSGSVSTFATLDGLQSADAVELTGRYVLLPSRNLDQTGFLGYDFKYGIQSASFYNIKSLAKQSENESPYSVGAYGGYAFGAYKQSVLLKYASKAPTPTTPRRYYARRQWRIRRRA